MILFFSRNYDVEWDIKFSNELTSMIVFKIFLNLIVKASDFFFKRLCPFWAPFNRSFIVVMALKIKNNN